MKATRRKIRGWVILFAVLGLLEISYVAATAVFLNTSTLAKLINTDPEKLWISYGKAFSVFPGIVHVSDVRLRVQDSNIQLHTELKEATVGINLFTLLRRQFHTTYISVNVASFRLRFRRPLKDITSEMRARLPPIPGLLSLEKKPSPPDDGPGNPWKIRLAGIHLRNLNEVWIEQYHFKGVGEVSGGFYLYPSHEAEVFSSRVEATKGNLWVGDDLAASQFQIAVSASIRRFQGNAVPDLKIFHYATGQVDFEASVKSIEFLNAYLTEAPWLRLDGAAGPLKAHVALREGKIEKETWIKFTSDDLRARLWRQNIVGKGALEWRVLNHEGDLTLRLTEYELKDPRRAKAKVSGKDLKIDALSSNLVIDEHFRPLRVKVLIPELTVSDLSAANLYLPRGAEIQALGGVARLRADFEASSDAPVNNHGTLFLDAKEANFKIGATTAAADLSLKSVLDAGDMNEGDLHLGADLLVNHVKGKKIVDGDKWWAKVHLQDAEVRVKDPKRVKGTLTLQSRDAKPIIQAYLSSQRSSLPGLVKDALAFDGLKVSVALSVDDKAFVLERVHASGEHADVKGWLTKRAGLQDGKFLVEYGPLAAGLDFRDDGVHLRLEDAYTWFRKQTKQHEADRSE